MPSFELVSAYAKSLLRRGLEPRDAERLHAYVLNGRPTPTRVQQDQLARVSALFAPYFTDASKEVWSSLTGIDVDHFEPATEVANTSWPKTLERDRAALEQRYPVARTEAGHVEVELRGLDVDALTRQRTGKPRHAGLTPQQAIDLALPAALTEPALNQPQSRTVARVLEQLAEVVRTRGDNDGRLRPRNLAGADATLAAVMQGVYAALGERVLSLEEIRGQLPQAIAALVLGGTARSNRHRYPDLYCRSQEDVVDHLVRGYLEEVLERGGSHTQYLERQGLITPTDKRRFLDVAEPLVPAPTLRALKGLYQRALGGELAARDFYNAARIDQDELFMLEARLPDHFPRPPQLKNDQALAAPISLGDASVDQVSAQWQTYVVEQGLTVSAFIAQTGIKAGPLRRLRLEHPDLFPPPPASQPVPRGEEFATALNAAMVRIREAEPFLKVRQTLDRVNDDPDFAVRFGEVSYERYYAARREHRELFVRMDASSHWQTPVLERVEQLLRDEPQLTRAELVTRLQADFPEMTYSRLTHLKEQHPELELPGAHGPREPGRIDAIAARVKTLLTRETLTLNQLAERLEPDFGALEPLAIGNIIRTQRRAMFSEVPQVDRQRLMLRRESLPARQLLALALATAPPGSTNTEVAGAFNRLLAERGLPELEVRSIITTMQDKLKNLGWPTPEQYFAGVSAELVAEYARAAPRGASEAEVLQRVFADYPRLEARLTRYRNLWQQAPDQYPALAPFLSRGALSLGGRGQAVNAPRFIGGWDAGRFAERAPDEERRRLAELTEFATIPMRLTEVDAVVDDHGAQKLGNARLLWVSHLLQDIVPMAFALKDASVNIKNTTVVGSPYGSNPAVAATLRDLGFSVHVPELSEAGYRAEVKRGLDQAVQALRESRDDAPLLVMDDGGLTTVLLHEDPAYADLLDRIRIVEQTTGGILLAEEHALKTSVLAVARARSKAVEGEGVGQVIAEKIVRRVDRSAHGLKGKRIVVLGNGPIGHGIIETTHAAGASVTLIDPNPEAAKEVPDGVKAVTDPARWQRARAAALAEADIVVGATGRNSLSLDDLLSLKDGATLVSASSKRREFPMAELEQVARREALPEHNPLVRMASAQYLHHGKRLVVLGDGWPLNFDGGVASLPAARIALTDAAMLDGLFQISGIQGRRAGLIDFDPVADERLLTRHDEALELKPDLSVYDIDAWQQVLRSAASLY
ncbi:MAG: NAD-binding protein [Archangiaceae bacterium]|nr:NAD-binding protein [Archangiaceae bacterium]